MEANPKPGTNKPDWLAKLEEESWQAELIISGAAIFGCLLLPDLLLELETWILDTINREGLLLWYMIMMFANMLAYTLIITFILHFALRALWIGMVGFNSVYPEGYQPNKAYSEDYQRKVMAEFSDINGYISSLDRICSSIFGGGFGVALMAFGYISVISVLAIVFYWLRDFISDKMAFWILIGALAVFVAYLLLNTVMSLKSMREKEWVKRWHYPMTKYFSKIVMNVGYRPSSYVFNVLGSRAGNTKYGMLVMVGVSMLIGGVGAGLGLNNMKVYAYIDRVYHRISSDDSALVEDHYADTRCDCTVYRPTIPDYEMYPGELLTVFMPLPNRELYELERQCDIPEIDDDLDNKEAWKLRRRRERDCAKTYYKFYLNDREITDYSLKRFSYGSMNQYGYLATFYGLDFEDGENLFKTESNYFNDDGEARTALIPFFYFSTESRPSDD